MKEGGAIILAVVSCSGDAVFCCERETTLFGIQKRTQLEIIGSTQILECVHSILQRTVS